MCGNRPSTQKNMPKMPNCITLKDMNIPHRKPVHAKKIITPILLALEYAIMISANNGNTRTLNNNGKYSPITKSVAKNSCR